MFDNIRFYLFYKWNHTLKKYTFKKKKNLLEKYIYFEYYLKFNLRKK